MLYDVGRNTCYFLPKIRAQAGVLTNNLHFLTCVCFVFQPHDANFACKKMDIFSNDDELTLNYEATADCTFSVKGISGKINLKKGEKKLINFWPK